MPLYINHGSEFVADYEYTKGVFQIGSSSQTAFGVTKPSIQMGYSDPDTKLLLYYYNLGRSSVTGFLEFSGNQTGFVGYVFDAPVMFPQLTTTQKNAISSPVEGAVVMDITLHALCVYNGTAWKTITAT